MSIALPIPVRPHLSTAKDLECSPWKDAHCELIRGEIIERPFLGGESGSRINLLSFPLSIYIEDRELGVCFASGTGFLIARNPDTVFAPDWAFIAKDRLPQPIPKGYISVIPDIVLETRSPSDTRREVALKVEQWLHVGVKIVWELNPATCLLTVHRSGVEPRILGREDTLTGEELLPGFTLPLQRVFR